MRSLARRLALALTAAAAFTAFAPPAARAQGEPAAPVGAAPDGQVPEQRPEPQGRPLDEATVVALDRLARDLDRRRSERTAAAAAGDTERLARIDEAIAQLRLQFAGLATRLDVKDFESPTQGRFQIQEEIEELVRPLLRALKDATSGPRRTSELEARIERVEERRDVVRAATTRLIATRDALPAGPARDEAERELTEVWQPRLERLNSEKLVLSANLAQLEEAQRPLLERVTDTTREFLQSSGLNVVLCAIVFTAVFFGLRFVANRLLRRREQRGFSMRLLEVLAQVLTVLLAVAATMVVPYARNDWLLLAVGIVFLVGAGWVVVKTAPLFVEQIRLLLNVGAVREGERLLVDGLPYRVDALKFYTRLVNPDLRGGVLRIPVRDLVGLRSRPLGADEPWFPSREGDVVALQDGTVGRVTLQTPEVVIVVERRDAPRSYPTAAYLQQNPRNLSAGFEVVDTFGVDYRHVKQAVTDVPEALAAGLREGLANGAGSDDLKEVTVELADAAESSIDYRVIVEYGGGAAADYHALCRKVNGLLVAACNRHGYEIPLPQLKLHRAPDQ